ncbi:MAG TPA: hypothetical protein VG347_21810 [Verrucomicrobiae bacterium]|nr:hypothetical protein [Verrucomicrobiae bacterium]
MKTFLTLAAVAALATVMLTGCKKSDSNYNGDATNQPSMSGGSNPMLNTNMPETNSVPSMSTNMPGTTN